MTEAKWCSCNPLREAQEKAAKWDEIVRCKDCMHLIRFLEHKGRFACKNRGLFMAEDDFCSWGERK